jgi:hypothetical protein
MHSRLMDHAQLTYITQQSATPAIETEKEITKNKEVR